ncbi:MAG: 30S ribosomal protein S5 [Candidatus Moranbacteria bacterium]|nr:30S ribosomal protein S5 [Candidatus Moranbacteria bacterium]
MKKRRGKKVKSEFDQKLIDLARVTRVVRGGRRFRFRATVAIGNKKGKVGIGIAKGGDVSDAMSKAFNKAKKALLEVPIWEGTIPHKAIGKFKSSQVVLKPAKKGKGIVVGGSVRQIVDLAGFKDLSAKILGKGSKVNNALAALEALNSIKALKEKKEIKTSQKNGTKPETDKSDKKKAKVVKKAK